MRAILRASVLSFGCALATANCARDAGITNPHAASFSVASGIARTDLSGTWAWSEEVQWVFSGDARGHIVPEGSLTHARCTDGGTITLSQSGDQLSGTLSQPIGTCVTRGGQTFANDIPFDFPISGHVDGLNMVFDFGGPGERVCPYHGVITLDDAGSAVHLNGSDHCVPFREPASPATTFGGTWSATRQ